MSEVRLASGVLVGDEWNGASVSSCFLKTKSGFSYLFLDRDREQLRVEGEMQTEGASVTPAALLHRSRSFSPAFSRKKICTRV